MRPTTCAGCSLLCGDSPIDPAASPVSACAMAGDWWAIGQRPRVERDDVEKAVALLAQARYPLFLGVEQLPCDDQRHVVELADWSGGVVALAGVSHTPHYLPQQGCGEFGTTLGEIRQRADLLVLWSCDPDRTHPRFFERIGDQAQRIVVRDDVEFAWRVRAGVQRPNHATDEAADLARRLIASRYAVLVAGGHAPHAAVRALALAVNSVTHCRILPLRENDANSAGARQVLGWQTGHHASTAFHRGHPASAPGDFDASRALAECDFVWAIDGPRLPDLAEFPGPVVACAAHPSTLTERADAVISLLPAPAQSGSACRCDGVMLPLVPPDSASQPTTDRVWEWCVQLLRAMQAG